MKKKTPHVRVAKFKPVFRGVVYTLTQAKALLPNGTVKIFERAERADTVTMLPVDSRGRLWMAKKYYPVLKQYQWSLPAGRLNKGESPRAGAQRELREETGYRARRLTPFFTAKSRQTMRWTRHYFIATDLVPDPLPEDGGEELTIVPISLKKAYGLALSDEIQDESVCFCIFKLHAMQKHLDF